MVKPSETGDRGSAPLAAIAPFLRKCYEMVDDESTDSIISWNDTNDSFVIWDMTQFSAGLLPKYFKHSNFSSFMRQLNIYGFRKVDTDRWIFANDGFIRGQKHLLKNICRRKYAQGPDQRKTMKQQEHHPEESFEKVENGLWKEVESLKIDKNALTQELVKLRQHQETAENKLLVLRERLQGMEKNQQQMLSFLVMAVQRPGIFVQFLQPKENNWRMSDAGNMLQEVLEDDKPAASGGTMIRYLPPTDETSQPMFTSTSAAAEKPPEPGSYPDGMQDFFLNSDFMKVLMDEKLSPLETHAPFILPELSDDDGSWEQLLLASPFRENSQDTKDDEDTTDTGMEDLTLSRIPLEQSQNFDSFDQMENPQNFGIDSTAFQAQSEKPHNMETLTKQMGLLSSELENKRET
ncbi:Heat shock transcription factor [Parasponia andersonii]|uniref:Heat shock transcription factor n=1 Tax=Parasponia andersonii TaxID=3476 RepID=A0A2P5D266_PARAD|nr:Heat shock transcription factor [Parasponia andersonii]